jgi:glutaminyl-peptide cyclotransferase
MKKIIIVALSVSFMISCKDTNTEIPTSKPTPTIDYTIVAKTPHDTNSFTEGLFFTDSVLFESTGAPDELPKSKSEFGIVNKNNGTIASKAKLDKTIYFGEGIIQFNQKIYQLTYKNQACFVYDATTFKKINTYYFANAEGWGLTTDGKHIIMSDGTNQLTYFTDSFTVVKKVNVTEDGYAAEHLNELEYINGYIYANVWTTDKIVKIDANTGNIVAKLDISSLKEQAKAAYPGANETNGIAYEPTSGKILVTGKNWPFFYQIKFDL